MTTGRSGLPDITAVLPPKGRLLLLECKAGNDKVREHQEKFMVVAGQQGACCAVLRSLADLESLIGVLRAEDI
jgi:VRR-NUC domain